MKGDMVMNRFQDWIIYISLFLYGMLSLYEEALIINLLYFCLFVIVYSIPSWMKVYNNELKN